MATNLQILLVHYVIYVKFKADTKSTNICGHEAHTSYANIPTTVIVNYPTTYSILYCNNVGCLTNISFAMAMTLNLLLLKKQWRFWHENKSAWHVVTWKQKTSCDNTSHDNTWQQKHHIINNTWHDMSWHDITVYKNNVTYKYATTYFHNHVKKSRCSEFSYHRCLEFS